MNAEKRIIGFAQAEENEQNHTSPEQTAYGGVAPGAFWSKDALVYNPDDLVEKKGLATYRKMVRTCPPIKMAILFLEDAVLSRGVEITDGKPVTHTAEEVAKAGNIIREGFKRTRGGIINGLIRPILQSRYMGFSVQEKVGGTISGGEYDGYWYYKRFGDLWQENITFGVDDFGEIVKIENQTTKGRDLIEGPRVAKFLVHTHRKEKDNPYGCSDLRDLYFDHVSIDRLQRYLNIALEKNALGGTTQTVPRGTSAEAKQAKLDALKKKHGSACWVVEEGDVLEHNFGDPSAGAAFITTIQFYATRILLGLGLPQTTFTGTGDAGEGGSLALAEQQTDTTDMKVRAIQAEVEDFVTKYAIIPMTRYNSGADFDDEECPRVTFPPYREGDAEARARLLQLAIDLGLEIPLDWAYGFIGLEKPEEGDEILSPPEKPNPFQPFPPGSPTPPKDDDEEDEGEDEKDADAAPGQFAEEGPSPDELDRRINLAEIENTLDSAAIIGGARMENAALGIRGGLRQLLKRRAPRLRQSRRMVGRSPLTRVSRGRLHAGRSPRRDAGVRGEGG